MGHNSSSAVTLSICEFIHSLPKLSTYFANETISMQIGTSGLRVKGMKNQLSWSEGQRSRSYKAEVRLEAWQPSFSTTWSLSMFFSMRYNGSFHSFRSAQPLSKTAITSRPQGVIIVGIYMSTNIYYLLLLYLSRKELCRHISATFSRNFRC